MKDYGYHDRQAFLQAQGRRWDDTTVGRVLTALAGALIVLLILGPRYGAELLAGVL